MSGNYVFLPVNQANVDNIEVGDPEEIITKDGTKFMRSSISYRNDRGDLCDMYFAGPKQFSFGISPEYPFGLPKHEQTEDKIKSFKICYNICDMRNVAHPSKEEKYMEEIFSGIHQKVVEAAHQESTLKKIGAAQAIVIRSAKQNNEFHGGVKPILSLGTTISPHNPNQRIPDSSKPKRIYAKLLSSKRPHEDIIIHTKFYGPGDRNIDPKKFINVQGYLEPVFNLQSIYWGAHGSTPYGASIQVKLSEANFTPMSRNGPPKRMLSANTSTVEEDDQSDDDNLEDGEEDAPKDTDEVSSEVEQENISPSDQLSRIVPEAVPVAVKAPRRKQTKRRVIRKQPISA
jgi:hypothetical protein